MAETGAELLQAYKEQYGIEKNFSFLKDPLIVNDIFLKKPERIEVLGTILLISLMIWNLIEHTLRLHIKECEVSLPGWDKKPTKRPTTFMMSTNLWVSKWSEWLVYVDWRHHLPILRNDILTH